MQFWMSVLGMTVAAIALLGSSGCERQAGETAPPSQASMRAEEGVTLDEARSIAREAYTYGYPLVDNYRIQYSYFVDATNPEYKAGWNQIYNNARVYTPDDKAIQTPNSDTPYSYVGADLRAEPLVLTVPAMEKNRFYHLQFIDQYTQNFAYVGTRTTGNDAGTFLLAGPRWQGEIPPGIKQVMKSETDFVFILYRTQLFEPRDLKNVKRIQSGYAVQTLSAFLGQPARSAPPIDFVKPLSPAEQRTSLEFFNVLNFVLQFCPQVSSEEGLRERFARIGVGPGETFDAASLAPEMRTALESGIADSWEEFKRIDADLNAGKISSTAFFGTREHLRNNYAYRMGAAVAGIYGNSAEEAIYLPYRGDTSGDRYMLRFAPGQLPPVDAFWSLTMYEMPASLLYANRLQRYLINSPMLPALTKDADGGVTLYIQHDSPGKAREPNWLPAPKGPMTAILRLYSPKPEVTNGTWKRPELQKIE